MAQRLKEKHMQEIVTQVREKQFDYKERDEKKINWKAYGKAQYREMSEMLKFIRQLVDLAEERVAARKRPRKEKPFGRPPEIPASDVLKVLLMQTYLCQGNRVAEGLELLFADKLGLRTEFSYKEIERGYDDPAVRELIDELRILTNEPVQGVETDFSIDGTGNKTSNKQHYQSDRSKQQADAASKKTQSDAFPTGSKPYVASVGVIGTKYKLYASWASTSERGRGERSMFKEVFSDAIALHPNMNFLLGDGLYANRPTCDAVGEADVTPVFLPARNATMKKKKVQEWVDMLTWLADNPQAFLSVYHMRSISETGYSMDKRANPKPIYKRLPRRKETVSSLRYLCHNIKQLVYIKYLYKEIQLTFSNRAN